ncbi:MAG: THUMP domain-containing protein, partial [Ardenticatenaceae bacterium]
MSDTTASHIYLLTAAADYLNAAVEEVRQADRELRQVGAAGDEIAVVDSSFNLREMYEALQRQEPIFLRHIAPVQLRLSLTGDRQHDLPALARETLALAEVQSLQSGDRFSVQARVVTPPRLYSPYAIADAVAPLVAQQMGATMDVRQPEIVISVLVTSTLG